MAQLPLSQLCHSSAGALRALALTLSPPSPPPPSPPPPSPPPPSLLRYHHLLCRRRYPHRHHHHHHHPHHLLATTLAHTLSPEKSDQVKEAAASAACIRGATWAPAAALPELGTPCIVPTSAQLRTKSMRSTDCVLDEMVHRPKPRLARGLGIQRARKASARSLPVANLGPRRARRSPRAAATAPPAPPPPS